MPTFFIKQLYKQFRGNYQKVDYMRLFFNNLGASKWCVIFYLAMKTRLMTRDKVAKWSSIDDLRCPLCKEFDDYKALIFYLPIFL